MSELQPSRDELLDLIRDLRGWADCYEDWMGPDDFDKRAKIIAKAEAILLAERGTLA